MPRTRPSATPVENLNQQQSYRENLAWAIEMAGRFFRTLKDPVVCPNDTAFFLYLRAKEEPKEFLTKLNQLEAKKVENKGRKASARSIKEIDEMLATLEQDEEEPVGAPRMG